MKCDIIKDLSDLTTTNPSTFAKLLRASEWCIGNAVEETQLAGENVTEVFIGIGTLLILTEEGSIKYKFVPTRALENNVKQTYLDGKNPLTLHLENTLAKKLTSVYKELL